jgi:chemotaxis protein methyltransferase CheR
LEGIGAKVITITDKEFKLLAAFIKAHYGIYLKTEKQALVTGRLQHVLIDHNFNSFSEYYDYLIADKTGNAAAVLINKITTNHTFFMREAEHFDYFKDKVLSYLKNTVHDRDLRIWSAGCSSGEEPYTLAMILDEYFGWEKNLWDSKILATDISGSILDKAMKGIYKSEEIASLPPFWRHSYLNKFDEENSIFNERIRNEVIFRQFNLMNKTYPFKKKFHVIFCRNVMIYFDAETKRELVNKFYDSMEYGGYLFIGHSESLNHEDSKFRYILPAVYRKE